MGGRVDGWMGFAVGADPRVCPGRVNGDFRLPSLEGLGVGLRGIGRGCRSYSTSMSDISTTLLGFWLNTLNNFWAWGDDDWNRL